MGLDIIARELGWPPLSRYQVPDTSLELCIIHSPAQYFLVQSPTEVSISDGLEIFRYIAEKESPQNENQLRVDLYEREGHTQHPLNVDLSVIEKELELPGSVSLHLPGKYFLLEIVGVPKGFSMVSTEDKLPTYLNEVIQKFGVVVPQEKLNDDLAEFGTELAFFKHLSTTYALTK